MTIAAKIGASLLAPFVAFGGAYHASTPTVRADVNQPATTCEITHSLFFGENDKETGGDVTKLQSFLRAQGDLTSAASGQFSVPTLRAVIKFQGDHNITRTGYVGSKTRALINEMSCGTGTTGPLSITSVKGPSSLAVNAEGTWTVNVREASSTTSLHYSVKWGDEPAVSALARAAAPLVATTSSTFTHTYTTAGTYTPTFTVTDDSGNTVTKAAHAVVVGAVVPAPTVKMLSATSGVVGTNVTLTGTGFTNDTTVHFGSTTASSTFMSSTALGFFVPNIATGTYPVSVSNANGTSTSLNFTVTAPASHTYLSISGIDAPITLAPNQDGTWTVHVNTNTTGTLHYSVTWGDENMFARAFAAIAPTVQTSGTFTHAYANAGLYTPKFTVTDDSGHTVSAGTSVRVLEVDQ